MLASAGALVVCPVPSLVEHVSELVVRGYIGRLIGHTSRKPCIEVAKCLCECSTLRQVPISTAMLCCSIRHLHRLAAAYTLVFLRAHPIVGSILSLFLAPDCGPREGAIRLAPEKLRSIPEEESRPTTPHFEELEERSLYGSIRHKVSGYFSKASPVQASAGPSQPTTAPVPLTPTRGPKQRTFSRVSRANGSAYGYSGSYRNRLSSHATMASRRGSTGLSIRRRRESNYDGAPSSVATGSDLNFAQRLLMANENAVTNIADLWVAAAINADNEDPFEESEDESDQEGYHDDNEQAIEDDDDDDDEDVFGSTSLARNNRFSRRISSATPNRAPGTSSNRQSLSNLRPSPFGRRPSSARRFSNLRRPSSSLAPGGTGAEVDELPLRRPSSTVPPIFSHVGVRTPPAVLEAQHLLAEAEAEEMDALAPIAESQRVSRSVSPALEAAREKEPSLWSSLPLAIICQYGWLALHSTTHDQVFYLYLVS